MLFAPGGGEFRLQINSHSGRPGSSFGTTLTCGNNTYGSYGTIISGSSVTEDCFGIMINANLGASLGTARDMILTVGRDQSGGSTYTDWLTHLLISCSAPYNSGAGGVWYYFPMYIRAGTSIGAKASCNAASSSVRVQCMLYALPRRPEVMRVATKFYSFGETTASSSGTALTVGQASEGAWTQVGSSTVRDLWWWQYGFGTNDSTMQGQAIHCEVSAGDATNKKILIQDAVVTVNTSEQIANSPWTVGCVNHVISGSNIYVRAQSSATPDSNTSMAVYGCG